MSIVLGSVPQRLKGFMPLKLIVMLAVCSLLTDVTSGLFYTNSKEHDYPRIGRRSGSNTETGVLQNSGEIQSYKHHQINRLPNRGRLNKSPAFIAFRAWDTNGDGFLSRSEFQPKMDQIFGRAP